MWFLAARCLLMCLLLRTSAPALTDTTGAAAVPESLSTVSGGVNKTRLYIVGGVMAASMAGIHLYQQSGWWKYNRTSFHFREDLTYGLSVDKIGHFYGTMLWAYAFRKVLAWADVPDRPALYFGSAGALLFQTFVEVEDGYSTWGFDRVDWLADLGGALWPVAQEHSGFLRSFDLKLSYKPTDLLNKPGGAGFVGQKHLLMDDYEGQTFWLAVNPERLPWVDDIPFWPGFLNLAVGYGARDVSGLSGEPYSVVFVGLDYDMKKIIPQSSPFLVTLSEVLNFLHFPAPAVRLSPSTVVYGLYY